MLLTACFLALTATPYSASESDSPAQTSDGGGKSGGKVEKLVEVEDAWAKYLDEKKVLDADRGAKLATIADKHRKKAQASKDAASAKGDLALALAWDEFQGSLTGEDRAKKADAEAGGVQEKKMAPPREIQKAMADLAQDRTDIGTEWLRKLVTLSDKHRKVAEAGRSAATKKKDTELALAWDEFAKKVAPAAKNVAKMAEVSVSARAIYEGGKRYGGAETLIDGTEAFPARAGTADKFWYAGTVKEAWIHFDFREAKAISRIRLSIPVGTAWSQNGHEPLDYEVLIRSGPKTVKKVTVHDGKHPIRVLSKDHTTQWISIDLKELAVGTSVDLQFHGSSGRGWAPVVFEVEVLALE
jgi:hypothetical protein